jgi:hypothetical protein
VAFRDGLVRFVLSPLALVSFVMTQKMMREIKERVESRFQATAAPTHV